MRNVRFIGLDVHAETIAVAAAKAGGEVRSLGVIPNRMESIRTLMKKLGPAEQLRVCYEAGPTGYVVYWQLAALGVTCEVVAPTLVPVKAGDRVLRPPKAEVSRALRLPAAPGEVAAHPQGLRVVYREARAHASRHPPGRSRSAAHRLAQ